MIVHLSPADFYVTSGNELANTIKGFSVVFFNSSTCVYCKDVFPAFNSASASIQGCTFALMNVEQDNMKVVKMSENTKNKLIFVPFIAMYANGYPIATFQPDEERPSANFELLKRFIVHTASELKSKSTTATKNSLQEGDVCPTSTGIALCGPRSTKVCYLTESDAYGGSQ